MKIIAKFIIYSSLLAVIFLFYPFEALANTDIVLERNSKGHLIFKSKSCEVLNKQTRALRKWKIRLHENASTLPKCICANNSCSVDLSGVAPKLVNEMDSKTAFYNGPNCWNTALNAAKIIPFLRESDPAEISIWLSSPLCRELSPGETPEPGDIVAIRNSRNEEIHAFNYITEEVSFSKNGAWGAEYGLHETDFVLKAYQVPPQCQHVYGYSPKCSFRAQYFSCMSMDDYMAQRLSPLPENLVQNLKKLESAECKISHKAIKGRCPPQAKGLVANDSTIIQSSKNIILSIQKIAREETQKSTDPEDQTLWSAISARIEGLLSQITKF